MSRGADCFHVNGQTSAAVEQQHDMALRTSEYEGTTANILRLLPSIIMADPTFRSHAWMLSEVFSWVLQVPESASTYGTRGVQILHDLSRATKDASLRIDRRINGDTSAPTEIVRGIWVSLSDRSYGPGEMTVATEAAISRDKAADTVSMPFGRDLPKTSPPSQHEEEPSDLPITTAGAPQRPVGSSSRGIILRTLRTMIMDSVANYRLTSKIIRQQLSYMFPEIPVTEIAIRVG